jgi:hypothetical protein
MPHDRSALINQLRELLTEKRHDSVVIHNYCRSARHLLAYWARPATVVGYGKAGQRIELPRFSRRRNYSFLWFHCSRLLLIRRGSFKRYLTGIFT